MKKVWEKPELNVLTRNKPEEAVLAVCKDGVAGGPGDVFNLCAVICDYASYCYEYSES